jgi:ribosome biogenesis GTPase
MQGTILRAQSGFFWVDTDEGIIECRLRGRLKKERQRTDIAVVGDRVEVTITSSGEGAIERVLERQSTFSRQQPGPRGVWKEDVLIANLDQVIIILAWDDPPLKPRLLDRFLVVAEYNEIDPVIVINKIDLDTEQQAREQLHHYEALGYRVFYVSAATGLNIDQLREQLSHRTSVFTGPSGVGKSSLLNRIQPGLGLQTGDVSGALRKGRHTTVVAQLIQLDGNGKEDGGYVADTPGIRELAAWRIPDEDLAWCFRDLRPFLGECDFNDCTHLHEPGCAVREAVEQEKIFPERYESYRRQFLKQER